jgi:hypothetical protein
MRPSPGWIAGVLVLGFATGVGAATWPGTAPCDTTLQACIDAAASGETIEVVTNGPIGESPTIEKSLTLRAATGFNPFFVSPNSIFTFGGPADVTVVIEGMTIENGRIVAGQGGVGVFDVTIRKNVVLDTFTFGSAIEVFSGNALPQYGPVSFEVSDNEVTVNGFSAGDQVSAISIGGFQSPASGSVLRNRIVQQGESTQNGAIDIANGDQPFIVDVIDNHVSGSGFNEGIGIFQFAPGGSTTARVINNVITGQIDVSGLPGGIALNVSQGAGSFTVVNNTSAGNENGLQVSGRADLGATITGVIANNIFANNTEDGMDLESDFAATLPNRYNLVFGNGGSKKFIPGPGTITSNPLFVSATDFHLQPGSPAINAGSNADLPVDITTDADGEPRVAGGMVDIGAFEARPPARFFTVAPCRVVDTRGANGPYGGPVLVGGAFRTFLLRGQCGIPTTARAVSANLTVVLPAAEGFLTAYPGGPFPLVSTLNYRANLVRANNAILTLDGSGNLLVFSSVATDLLLDVNGYFE